MEKQSEEESHDESTPVAFIELAQDSTIIEKKTEEEVHDHVTATTSTELTHSTSVEEQKSEEEGHEGVILTTTVELTQSSSVEDNMSGEETREGVILTTNVATDKLNLEDIMGAVVMSDATPVVKLDSLNARESADESDCTVGLRNDARCKIKGTSKAGANITPRFHCDTSDIASIEENCTDWEKEQMYQFMDQRFYMLYYCNYIAPQSSMPPPRNANRFFRRNRFQRGTYLVELPPVEVTFFRNLDGNSSTFETRQVSDGWCDDESCPSFSRSPSHDSLQVLPVTINEVKGSHPNLSSVVFSTMSSGFEVYWQSPSCSSNSIASYELHITWTHRLPITSRICYSLMYSGCENTCIISNEQIARLDVNIRTTHLLFQVSGETLNGEVLWGNELEFPTNEEFYQTNRGRQRVIFTDGNMGLSIFPEEMEPDYSENQEVQQKCTCIGADTANQALQVETDFVPNRNLRRVQNSTKQKMPFECILKAEEEILLAGDGDSETLDKTASKNKSGSRGTFMSRHMSESTDESEPLDLSLPSYDSEFQSEADVSEEEFFPEDLVLNEKVVIVEESPTPEPLAPSEEFMSMIGLTKYSSIHVPKILKKVGNLPRRSGDTNDPSVKSTIQAENPVLDKRGHDENISVSSEPHNKAAVVNNIGDSQPDLHQALFGEQKKETEVPGPTEGTPEGLTQVVPSDSVAPRFKYTKDEANNGYLLTWTPTSRDFMKYSISLKIYQCTNNVCLPVVVPKILYSGQDLTYFLTVDDMSPACIYLIRFPYIEVTFTYHYTESYSESVVHCIKQEKPEKILLPDCRPHTNGLYLRWTPGLSMGKQLFNVSLKVKWLPGFKARRLLQRIGQEVTPGGELFQLIYRGRTPHCYINHSLLSKENLHLKTVNGKKNLIVRITASNESGYSEPEIIEYTLPEFSRAHNMKF